MIASADFPRLNAQNHRITSPPSLDYNCVAWSAGDNERWWQPGVYRPIACSTEEFGIDILEQAFLSLGFECCDDGGLESEYSKVAIYGDALCYTHAARQLANGKWTSKLGRTEDIEHDTPYDVAGGVYGALVRFLRKPVDRKVPTA